MIHPSSVRGYFRSRRTALGLFLGLIFLAGPWWRIGGKPAFLIDLPNRKFSLFGVLFWGHDVPLVLFLVVGFLLFVALVTAVFGRVWCGWACPQTVFIDLVFRRIETFCEGDAVVRRRAELEPYDGSRFIRSGLKWVLYLFAAVVVSHSLLAYFVGTDALFEMVRSAPSDHPAIFTAMIFVSGFTLFNFGWFRERFCTHICPYGRFQTVLLDDRSWVVAYDRNRGEPRRGIPSEIRRGDCIECGKCVSVCPTGIDIRNGLQLECIGCTACIDACDAVMRKLGRRERLIGYGTLDGNTQSLKIWNSILRPRPLVYLSAVILIGTWLAMGLGHRSEIDLYLVRSSGSPYELIERTNRDPLVVNRFNIDVHDLDFDDRLIELVALDGKSGLEVISADFPLVLRGGEQRRASAFFRFPRSLLRAGTARVSVRLSIHNRVSGKISSIIREVSLVGPY